MSYQSAMKDVIEERDALKDALRIADRQIKDLHTMHYDACRSLHEKNTMYEDVSMVLESVRTDYDKVCEQLDEARTSLKKFQGFSVTDLQRIAELEASEKIMLAYVSYLERRLAAADKQNLDNGTRYMADNLAMRDELRAANMAVKKLEERVSFVRRLADKNGVAESQALDKLRDAEYRISCLLNELKMERMRRDATERFKDAKVKQCDELIAALADQETITNLLVALFL